MSKLEKEFKVLEIDVDIMKKKLKEIGATYIEESVQKIYNYDLSPINTRFCEIIQLAKSTSPLVVNVNVSKFINLIKEVFDLFDESQEQIFFEILAKYNISQTGNNFDFATLQNLPKEKILKLINDEKLFQLMNSFETNPNKWVRLRQTNDKTTLTVKHLSKKKNQNFQYVQESEVGVFDLEQTNNVLLNLGFFYRNYFEKRRTSFTYKNAEIEIDEWPKLSPYLEIECDNDEVIEELIELLELRNNRIVSVNTEVLYAEIGIDILAIPVLKFD